MGKMNAFRISFPKQYKSLVDNKKKEYSIFHRLVIYRSINRGWLIDIRREKLVKLSFLRTKIISDPIQQTSRKYDNYTSSHLTIHYKLQHSISRQTYRSYHIISSVIRFYFYFLFRFISLFPLCDEIRNVSFCKYDCVNQSSIIFFYLTRKIKEKKNRKSTTLNTI